VARILAPFGAVLMRKCCGCKGGAAEEPPQDILDLYLLEANERSVKFTFCAPRASTRLQNNAEIVRRGPLQFVISILGGPYSDVVGPREERVSDVRCGTRVNHEVADLQPQTEYTITVGLLASANGDMLLQEKVEARTADASTALFAGEDWGRCSKNGKGNFKDADYMKDLVDLDQNDEAKAESKSGASSSSSAAASSSSAGAAPAAPQTSAQAARADSQDDVSTNAPSEAGEAGEDGIRRESAADDNASDWGSEAELAHESTDIEVDPSSVTQDREAASSAARASGPSDDGEFVQMINVIDVSPARALPECKLCSVLDCFKTSTTATGSGDIVIERMVAPKPKPKPTPKRPYRMPFPGIPVDPGTVGRRAGPGDVMASGV